MDRREMKRKLEDKLRVEDLYKAPINSGLPPLSTSLKFFHAIKQGKIADIEVTIKKINLPSQLSTWERSQLEKRKADLRQLFTDSNKAVKDNKASTSRFRELIRDRKIDKISIQDQTENVTLEIKDYKKIISDMEKYVNEYSVYETFLESVATDGSEFNSVGDILNRYETLEHTRIECSKLLEEELIEASEMRKAMINLLDDKSNLLKNLRNKFVMLQVRCKQAKDSRMYWEHTVQRLKNVIMSKEEERVALCGACWDLYKEACTRRRVPAIAGKQDLDVQLEFIKKSVIFYKEVVTIAASGKQSPKLDT